jgi:thiol-disulfide isomerase/thioredoxin
LIKKTYYSLLAAFLFLMSACSDKDEHNTPQKAQIDPNAPKTISLLQMSGNELNITYAPGLIPKFKHLDISSHKGKILFLDFFKTDCQPCRDEIPHLVNLQDKYKDQFQVIGINVGNEAITDLRSFSDYYHLNYPLVEAGQNYIMTDLVGGVRGVPAMFMYDEDGNYFTHYLGAVPQAMIENDIKKLLGK